MESLTEKEILDRLDDACKAVCSEEGFRGYTMGTSLEFPFGVFREVNLELIVHEARTFTKGNAFRNKYNSWMGRLYNFGAQSIPFASSQNPVYNVWHVGIMRFYKKMIQEELGTLADLIHPPVAANRGKSTGTAQVDLAPVFAAIGNSSVTALCASPVVIRVLKLLPKMVLTLRVAGAFAFQTRNAVPTNPQNNARGEKIMLNSNQAQLTMISDEFNNPEWLFYVFLLLKCSIHLSFSMGNKAAAMTTDINSNISGISATEITQVHKSLVDILCAPNMQSKDVLALHMLFYVRDFCVERCPPKRYTDLVKKREEEKTERREAIADNPFTRESFKKDALADLFLFEVPKLLRTFHAIRATESGFEADHVAATVVMQVYLHTMDDTSSYVSLGTDFSSLKTSFLFHLMQVLLDPLVRQLLHATPGREDEERAAADAGVPQSGEEKGGSKEKRNLTLTQAQRDAADCIAMVAAAASEICLPKSNALRRRMWQDLGFGEQSSDENPVGCRCFALAMEKVVKDVMVDMLVWTTLDNHHWANACAGGRNDKQTISDEELFPFLKYVVEAERLFYVITSADSGVIATLADGSADDSENMKEKRLLARDALCECAGQFSEAVLHALKFIYPGNAGHAIIVPVVNAIHAYLWRCESGAEGINQSEKRPAPPVGAIGVKARVPPPGPAAASFLHINSHEELRCLIRLGKCTESQDLFCAKYDEMMKVRLLFRPPPDTINDELLDRNKRHYEMNAIECLLTSKYEQSQVAPLKQRCESFAVVYYQCAEKARARDDGSAVKLTIVPLDYHSWTENQDLSAKDLNAKEVIDASAMGVFPSAESPLPFPPELRRALNDYISSNGDNTHVAYRWYKPSLCRSTFTLVYPKEKGRPVTVNGTLLLNQLFLAIAQYKRDGVSYGTLAKRAGMKTIELRRMFKNVVEKEHLLTHVPDSGKDDEQKVSLNYEYSRPPNINRGITIWPGMQRSAAAIDAKIQEEMEGKRRNLIQAIIVKFMKSKRECTYADLRDHVTAEIKDFCVTPIRFKQMFSRMVEGGYIERYGEGKESNVRYLS